jgi:hypothetical protein
MFASLDVLIQYSEDGVLADLNTYARYEKIVSIKTQVMERLVHVKIKFSFTE